MILSNYTYTNNIKEDSSKEREYINLPTEQCVLLNWGETIEIVTTSLLIKWEI